ncbi:MAG: TrkA family potassium uptake protein, partial [Rikenellaceae bacterium]
MKYIVLGLGTFGSVLATELSALGHEVIGADFDEGRVEHIKEKIATAYRIDATDSLSLASLPLQTVDVVIVAVGEDFGASIKMVALLKQIGVKKIYARAIDNVHKTILEAFKIDRILTPESDSAHILAQSMDLGVNVEAFQIDDQYYVLKFKTPKNLIGLNANTLPLESEFNIKVIGVKHPKVTTNFLGI